MGANGGQYWRGQPREATPKGKGPGTGMNFVEHAHMDEAMGTGPLPRRRVGASVRGVVAGDWGPRIEACVDASSGDV